MRLLSVAIRIDVTCGVQGGENTPPPKKKIFVLPNNSCVATESEKRKLTHSLPQSTLVDLIIHA